MVEWPSRVSFDLVALLLFLWKPVGTMLDGQSSDSYLAAVLSAAMGEAFLRQGPLLGCSPSCGLVVDRLIARNRNGTVAYRSAVHAYEMCVYN